MSDLDIEMGKRAEALARASCSLSGFDPDEKIEGELKPRWRWFIEDAAKIILTVAAANLEIVERKKP